MLLTTFILLSTLLQTPEPNKFNHFLLLGYGVMWLVGLVYVINLANKQRNVQQDVRLMRRLLEEEDGNDT